MSCWKLFWACVCAAVAVPAIGQVELSVHQTDASSLGPDFIVADVFVRDVDPADWMTVGGLAGGPVRPGIVHYLPAMCVTMPCPTYFDPATGCGRHCLNFVSIAGGFDPLAPAPEWTPERVNIAWLQFPPSTDGHDVPDEGCIARVVLQNDPVGSGFSSEHIYVAPTPAPGVLLAEYHVAAGTKNFPSPLAELRFGFYWLCRGDVDGNGAVEIEDLMTLLTNFGLLEGATVEDGDLDHDGDVDLLDLAALLSALGTEC